MESFYKLTENWEERRNTISQKKIWEDIQAHWEQL